MSTKIMTGFLFSDPSFLSGMARTLDAHGLYDAYNVSISSQEADAKALWADWAVVGQDLQDSIDEFQDVA